MFDFLETTITGCYEIVPRVHIDQRGRFIKVFHKDVFDVHGLETGFNEEYYSVSKRGVVRGMHFQKPPMDHVKIVYCVHGSVFDAVIDLRMGSPTFGRALTFELSALKGNYLYIPKGLAHGFCATSDEATLVYKVSTVYSREHDDGVLWNSIGVDWPVINPVISERDQNFSPFSTFKSPF